MAKVAEQVAAAPLLAGGDTDLHSHAGGGIPSGAILMWHGLIADIPSGWVICNGNNGTPNLLGRFVEGVATASTNPGITGGDNSPTVSLAGGHRHSVPRTGASNYTVGSGSGSADAASYQHTHAMSDTGNISNHRHTIANGRPLYYTIAFIMKI